MSLKGELWWGYRHANGSYQVKRYFDDRDLEDAHESPFVERVVQPFRAESREQALEIIRRF